MRVLIIAVAVCLAAGCSAALAQEAGPPVLMPPPEAMPPASVPLPSPEARPRETTPPAFATPGDLVGKSVRDLEQGRLGAAAKDDIRALRRGPLLIHGNYCGIGNRPGAAPIDDLDAACMRHDACTHTGSIPNCRCDDRLRAEATEIAKDSAIRPDVRAIAAATAAGMAVLICK